MVRFLVDADLPRSLARSLQTAGLQADDVRDLGLRKSSDDDIFSYALAHGLAILSTQEAREI